MDYAVSRILIIRTYVDALLKCIGTRQRGHEPSLKSFTLFHVNKEVSSFKKLRSKENGEFEAKLRDFRDVARARSEGWFLGAHVILGGDFNFVQA